MMMYFVPGDSFVWTASGLILILMLVLSRTFHLAGDYLWPKLLFIAHHFIVHTSKFRKRVIHLEKFKLWKENE